MYKKNTPVSDDNDVSLGELGGARPAEGGTNVYKKSSILAFSATW